MLPGPRVYAVSRCTAYLCWLPSIPACAGCRRYTFFLYLSDVEEGGNTTFDRLGDGQEPGQQARALHNVPTSTLRVGCSSS